MRRVAKAPLGDRQALVEAARRVMGADGQVRPIDRLRWLTLRVFSTQVLKHVW